MLVFLSHVYQGPRTMSGCLNEVSFSRTVNKQDSDSDSNKEIPLLYGLHLGLPHIISLKIHSVYGYQSRGGRWDG